MQNKGLVFMILMAIGLVACSDNDEFTTSPSAKLLFSVDSVKMDTVFTEVGSRTYDFWVHNPSDKGLRLQSVRLMQGNQTGFRANVDGTYLDNATGAMTTGLEVRGGDSLRVFVELTAPRNGRDIPVSVEDRLIFTLESGVQQSVVLTAQAWDAEVMTNVVVKSDSTIECERPVVVYGGLCVDSGATLTIRNTVLYFHQGKGIDVYGRLLTDSVTLRGDRLDHMFDYLPYDRVSGQWGQNGGVVIHASSTGNVMQRTVIRNAGRYGVVCDSSAFDSTQLKLDLLECVIHNCTGTGLASRNANIRARQCEFSNMGGDCVDVSGGHAVFSRCTMAQFYPFVGGRGLALRFGNAMPLNGLLCDSCIVTGYDDDVWLAAVYDDSTSIMDYAVTRSLLRSPRVTTADSVHFNDVVWELPTDSIQGKAQFILVDEDNLMYDFHLDSLSTVKGWGCY